MPVMLPVFSFPRGSIEQESLDYASSRFIKCREISAARPPQTVFRATQCTKLPTRMAGTRSDWMLPIHELRTYCFPCVPAQVGAEFLLVAGFAPPHHGADLSSEECQAFER